jgi:hypothetical protein
MGRELHWESIEVKARLDGEGSLRVVERQRFVFSGDWNGGERRFRVEDGQGFRFGGIRRIDMSGAPTPLRAGDLSRLDQYRLEGSLLRWRSRHPHERSRGAAWRGRTPRPTPDQGRPVRSISPRPRSSAP